MNPFDGDGDEDRVAPAQEELAVIPPAPPADEPPRREALRTDDVINELKAQIVAYNHLGTDTGRRAAARIQAKVDVMTESRQRHSSLTVERLARWTEEITLEAEAHGLNPTKPATWPTELRDELFEALQLASAASAFNQRTTARLMGLTSHTVNVIQSSPEYSEWSAKSGRRHIRAHTLIDLSMARAGALLAIDTDNEEVVKQQVRLMTLMFKHGLAPHPPEPPPAKQLPGTFDDDEIEEEPKPAVTLTIDVDIEDPS